MLNKLKVSKFMLNQMVAVLHLVSDVSNLKQHKQMILYRFSLQVMPHVYGTDGNLVRNNSQMSKKNPVLCIFKGGKKLPLTKIILAGPFGQMGGARESNCIFFFLNVLVNHV